MVPYEYFRGLYCYFTLLILYLSLSLSFIRLFTPPFPISLRPKVVRKRDRCKTYVEVPRFCPAFGNLVHPGEESVLF